MIRIYLDQKDYIRVAWGLLGKEDYLEDMKTYKYLLKEVDSGNVRVYYSDRHLVEATDYVPEGSMQFDKYIEVLKSLTGGNCMVSFRYLVNSEISLYIGELCNIDLGISNVDYPYGKHSEAIFTDIPLDFDFDIGFNRFQRKQYSKELNGMTPQEISMQWPGSEKMNKSDFIYAITGSYSDVGRIKKIREYLDIVFNIEGYLMDYRNMMSGALIPRIEERVNPLLEYIVDYRAKFAKEDRTRLNEKMIYYSTYSLFNEPGPYWAFIRKLCKKNDLNFEYVLENTKKNFLNKLISLECMMLVLAEYFGKHKDKRKPDQNDRHDLDHMMYLPYVDIYVCERFFAEVSKKIAPRYDTKVFRNLKQLREYLEKVLTY